MFWIDLYDKSNVCQVGSLAAQRPGGVKLAAQQPGGVKLAAQRPRGVKLAV